MVWHNNARVRVGIRVLDRACMHSCVWEGACVCVMCMCVLACVRVGVAIIQTLSMLMCVRVCMRENAFVTVFINQPTSQLLHQSTHHPIQPCHRRYVDLYVWNEIEHHVFKSEARKNIAGHSVMSDTTLKQRMFDQVV